MSKSSSKIAPFSMDLLKAAMLAKGGTGGVTLDSYNPATDDELIKNIQEATELYPALRSLAYRMPGRRQDNGTYLTKDEMVNILEYIMDTSVAADAGHVRHDDWLDRRGKISDLVTSAIEKEKEGVRLTDVELLAMAQGESFIETQKMLAASTRPFGLQRETTISDVEKRFTDLLTPADTSGGGAEGTGDFVGVNAGLLSENVIPPIKWVLPRMIPEMATVSIAGMSNVGKTRWLASLLAALAAGDTERMGLPQCDKQVASMWLANEERVSDICRRIKAVNLQHGDKESADIIIRGKDSGMMRLVAMNEGGNLEIDERNLAIIVAEARRTCTALIVFDPYVTLSDQADENSASSAAMLTKAFLLISTRTGAAVIHAHHTPKDRNKDLDWVRGDASAWRGSGAIYSALDCGFTLANWMPRNKDQKKAWKQQFLDAKLSRWVVLDTAKIREGEPLDPVVYELVGQEMSKDEGDPIGVCRVSNEDEAVNTLLIKAADIIGLSYLAAAIAKKFGEGSHKLSDVHKEMKGQWSWPDNKVLKEKALEIVVSMFKEEVSGEGGTVQIKEGTKKTTGKWQVIIRDKDATS